MSSTVAGAGVLAVKFQMEEPRGISLDEFQREVGLLDDLLGIAVGMGRFVNDRAPAGPGSPRLYGEGYRVQRIHYGSPLDVLLNLVGWGTVAYYGLKGFAALFEQGTAGIKNIAETRKLNWERKRLEFGITAGVPEMVPIEEEDVRADYDEFMTVARDVLDPDQLAALEAALAEPEPTEYVPDNNGNIVEKEPTPEWLLVSRRLHVLEQLAHRSLGIAVEDESELN
jgi:hypothetical protein